MFFIYLFFLFTLNSAAFKLQSDFRSNGNNTWSYEQVRPGANMFWWLYHSTSAKVYTELPLVLWLQGGPGASSTGYGNFMELGPVDINGNLRNTTWLSRVNLLFIDNPVGTGYSYATNDNAFTTDVAEISADLLAVMKSFLKKNPKFQTIPFYIFCESYGGKMTSVFAVDLYKAIQAKELSCDFRGVALGDSWISPIDSVMTWAPYLYQTSLLDSSGYAAVMKVANSTQAAVNQGQWEKATQLWSTAEDVIEANTDNVDFYNILNHNVGDDVKKCQARFIDNTPRNYIRSLFCRHVNQDNTLASLMNGPIRKYLGIIPDNVTWGGQAGQVFSKQSVDFMKPVIDSVDELLQTDLSVVVYNGQLDLIVDTPGTLAWVEKLKWEGLTDFNKVERKPLYTGTKGKTAAFYKTYKNFSIYWILNSGHMVPKDAGDMALKMMSMVTDTLPTDS